MLIKIDKDRYINSEHISMIAPSTDGDVSVYFIALLGRDFKSEGIETTAAVVEYIKTILDVDNHFTEQSVTLSLSSQIAIILSNSAEPKTLKQIAEFFNLNISLPEIHSTAAWMDIEASVNKLLLTNVIRSEYRNDATYYSHAANASPYQFTEDEHF